MEKWYSVLNISSEIRYNSYVHGDWANSLLPTSLKEMSWWETYFFTFDPVTSGEPVSQEGLCSPGYAAEKTQVEADISSVNICPFEWFPHSEVALLVPGVGEMRAWIEKK